MTHFNVKFMRLEIKLEAGKTSRGRQKSQYSSMGSIKKTECKFPVNEPGNDLLNILICVQGKDCILPDIASDQTTKSVVLAKKA
jgi:hypothetical protein